MAAVSDIAKGLTMEVSSGDFTFRGRVEKSIQEQSHGSETQTLQNTSNLAYGQSQDTKTLWQCQEIWSINPSPESHHL